MTKQDLQKELKEKVKAGVKPSDLRKLKRSRSEGDIPSTNPPPLTSSKPSFADPQYPYTTLIAQQQEIEKLTAEKDQLTTELTKVNQQIKELNDLPKPNNLTPPLPLLTDQLAEKQKQIENLREQLETAHSQIKQFQNPSTWPSVPLSNPETEELSDLDQSLVARHKALRDWFTEHEKAVKLEAELAENIDYASEELIRQDDEIIKLKKQVIILQRDRSQLSRDLELAQRAVEWRKNPYLEPKKDGEWLRYLVWGAVGVSLVVWLTKRPISRSVK